MSEAKHTEGPWKVSKANPHRVIVAEGEKAGLDIADIRVFVAAYRETSLANARLIAAGPDLLKALKLAKDHAELEDEVLDIVDAAIAKAEGRP